KHSDNHTQNHAGEADHIYFVSLSLRIVSNSCGDTGWTDKRAARTSTISFNRLSAFTSASVTGLFSAFLGATITAAHSLSFGSGKCSRVTVAMPTMAFSSPV